MSKDHPVEVRAREYQKSHPGIGYQKAKELSQIEYRQQLYDPLKPNHFYYDSLGDPMKCTGPHNHPTSYKREPAINEQIRRETSAQEGQEEKEANQQ